MTIFVDVRVVPIEAIDHVIRADMRAVDEVIRDQLQSEVTLIRQVSNYIINSGGKRLRPALVLLSAGASGYSGRAQHVLAGVAECSHAATLPLGDVVDE